MARSVETTGSSLSLRLLGIAGGSIAIALALAWTVLGILFERHAERQLESELQRQGIALIAALNLNPQGQPELDRLPADPRFQRPASGLYWLISGSGPELRSRSLWDGHITLPTDEGVSGWTRKNSIGPFEPAVMIVTRTVQPEANGPRLRVAVAADRASLIAARAAFDRETAIFLTALWFLLALAAWFQVQLGLRPLAAIRSELDRMSQAADVRLNIAAHPAEIRPLTMAINRVADQRADDIVRARKRAKDLAHALKTPLTALRLQINSLSSDVAQDLMHSLTLVTGAVEGELARTGLKNEAGSTETRKVVDRITAVVHRTPAGQRIAIHNQVPANVRLPMSDDSALEAFGALIENAVRHARVDVIIAAGLETSFCWITITDDGLGIPQGLRDAVLERGRRLDERSGSHGLGLSIAHDLIGASGGTLTLEEAGSGGLVVRAVWPVA